MEIGDILSEVQLRRFWDKVDRSAGGDGCWVWTAAKNCQGYGMFKVNGRMRMAHRLSVGIIEERSEIPVVRHLCNNPSCVNPDHLLPGTQAENLHDMRLAGRSLTGEKNHQSRLTEDDVREIRRKYREGGVSQRALAAEFGVVQRTIATVVNRITWTHVA